MNRSFWLILLLFFSATAVGAGWFAVNAPEASRPSFADLGAVSLTKETPPLPPAPLSRPGGKGYENVLRRPLFQSAERPSSRARQAAGEPETLGSKSVGYRTVFAPVAPVPALDFDPVSTPRAPQDDFQAAFDYSEPTHKQFFGAHLMSPDSLATDGAPPALSAAAAAQQARSAAKAPSSVPIPRLRPKKRDLDAPLSPAEEAVAAAATRSERVDPEPLSSEGRQLSPEEEIVLLGVLLRQGAGNRALIRLASGESRRVTLGDEVAGWRVSSIKADSILLKRASVTREIKVPE